MKNILTIALVIVLFVSLVVWASDSQLSEEQQLVRQALTNKALENADQVKIFYMPEEVVTVMALDGPSLERACYGSISIRHFQYSKIHDKLLEKLKSTSITAKEKVAMDYRWGCVFLDGKGNRLLSLYFTRGGAGRVNDVPVTTDGAFLDFLREEFKYLTELW
jgi:hypothetical protein